MDYIYTEMKNLKYCKLSNEWINGLPIGNGRLAAMYWGNDEQDIFSLNHESLWSSRYKGKEAQIVAEKLPELRDMLKRRDYFSATVYANLFFGGMGGDSGTKPGRIDSYQPAGNIVFEENKAVRVSDSQLDIDSALISSTRGTTLCNAFCDSNDGNILIKWQNPNKISGKLFFERTADPEAEYEFSYLKNKISFKCRFVFNAQYEVTVLVDTDGQLKAENDHLYIDNASYITVCSNIILSDIDERELSVDFDRLFNAHKETFARYMNRVDFSIEAEDKTIPTNERILKIRDGEDDIKLQELYFHYGRYLMISSSICGSLPPNLQGKWNNVLNPMWQSDYHLDINLQMNEWMIESANLSEFAEPLADFLLNTINGGRKAAKNLYGCRGIWLPIANDIWGEPTPESFGYAVWVGAAAWIAQPLWEHYRYTGDIDFLKNKAYKFFKEVALFYEDFLEEDENGILQIMPSQSPENRFAGAGIVATVGICSSSAIDVQLAYDALGYAIESAKILGVDSEQIEIWETLRKKLPPFAIGSDGRLMEWNEEFEEEQPGHKHLSHLYGLYPSEIFTPEKRKKEYDAAAKSFAYRMANESGYTGWSRAWISNIYARLGDGENFYKQITGLLRDFATESLLDIHPDPVSPGIGPDIFQIDGNFGMVSAVIEALCGYFDNKVHLLNALPKPWSKGHIRGVKLPGGHTISFEWENSKITKLSVVMGFTGSLCAVLNGEEILIQGNPKEEITVL